MHGGLGFLPQHAAMTADFEKSLQSVDPSVSMVYWDYTIEGHHMSTTTGHVNAWYDSIVFNESWFGPIGSDSDHPEVAVGRFAYHPIALRATSRATRHERVLAPCARRGTKQQPVPHAARQELRLLSPDLDRPDVRRLFTQMQQKVWSPARRSTRARQPAHHDRRGADHKSSRRRRGLPVHPGAAARRYARASGASTG